MKKIILAVVMVSILLTGCSSDNEKEITIHKQENVEVEMISVDDVKEIVDNLDEEENVVIIDVRTVQEYAEGHIAGAINLPLDIISNIDVAKDKKVIVYCRSGRRSNLAAIELIGLGYENVYDMGGLEDWPYDLDD